MIEDYYSDEKIRKYLAEDEKLIWFGRPKQGVVFRKSDIFMIPFSFMWGGFALFWETTVLIQFFKPHSNMPIIFPLFGIPFVLIGIYFIAGRFWTDSKRREKTFYGLTNKRVLIISGIFSQSVKTLDVQRLPALILSEKSDGKGTITFGQSNPLNCFEGFPFPGMDSYMPAMFESIDNAMDVYEKIRELS